LKDFFFLSRQVFNSDNFSIAYHKQENAQITFAEKSQMKINDLKNKTWIMDI